MIPTQIEYTYGPLAIEPTELSNNCIFFDIETTGLSPKRSSLLLAGLVYKSGNSFKVHQLISESQENEATIIASIAPILQSKKYIITYNGLGFDLPFFNTKCQQYGIPFDLSGKILIDLYLLVKINPSLSHLDNFKLQTVEKMLSISRQDTLTGKDIAKLYSSYLINPKREYLDLIIQHNASDILNLPSIWQYLYNEMVTEKDLIIKTPSFNLLLFESTSFSKNNKKLHCKFRCFRTVDVDVTIHSFLYQLTWNKQQGRLALEVLVKKGKRSNNDLVYYVDLKEFGLSSKNSYLVLSINDRIQQSNFSYLTRLIIEFQLDSIN